MDMQLAQYNKFLLWNSLLSCFYFSLGEKAAAPPTWRLPFKGDLAPTWWRWDHQRLAYKHLCHRGADAVPLWSSHHKIGWFFFFRGENEEGGSFPKKIKLRRLKNWKNRQDMDFDHWKKLNYKDFKK